MKRSRTFIVGLLFAFGTVAHAADSAQSLLDAARQKGKASGQNVLVIFHASWCGWCHKLDDFLTKTDTGKSLSKNIQVIHFTVDETPQHKSDENPGAVEMRATWGGDKAGLPFMAIIDSKTGKMLANSMFKDAKGKLNNTGYPAAPEEVAHFETMLKLGAKNVKPDLRGAVVKWLTENAPK